jgi:hypothetical protein
MNFSGPLYKYLLGKKGEVARLVTQGRELQQLTRLLHKVLDPSLAPHCRVGRFAPPQLTVVVDSPAWASRLRFQSNGLIRQLNKKFKEFNGISSIETKIYPVRLPRRESPVIRRQISPAAAESLTQMANSIEEPSLKRALLRLASRANK